MSGLSSLPSSSISRYVDAIRLDGNHDLSLTKASIESALFQLKALLDALVDDDEVPSLLLLVVGS